MDISRYEVNRIVRTVLIRHDVDLTRIDFSYIGSTVYLNGELFKIPDGEFTPSGIDDLVREIAGLSAVRDIQFDLRNWTIVSTGGSWQIMKTKKGAPAATSLLPQESGAVSTDSTVHIKKAETIADALKRIHKKEEPRK